MTRLVLLLAVVFAGCAAPRPSADIRSGDLPGAATIQPRTGAPQSTGSATAPAPPTPHPTGGIGKPATGINPHPPKDGVTGTATWFDAPWGTAAAGPALRDYLGTDWRGTVVSVTAPGCGCPAVVVILDDWCFCGSGRVIDLNRGAFANLGMPSLGVLKVIVREIHD